MSQHIVSKKRLQYSISDIADLASGVSPGNWLIIFSALVGTFWRGGGLHQTIPSLLKYCQMYSLPEELSVHKAYPENKHFQHL